MLYLLNWKGRNRPCQDGPSLGWTMHLATVRSQYRPICHVCPTMKGPRLGWSSSSRLQSEKHLGETDFFFSNFMILEILAPLRTIGTTKAPQLQCIHRNRYKPPKRNMMHTKTRGQKIKRQARESKGETSHHASLFHKFKHPLGPFSAFNA